MRNGFSQWIDPRWIVPGFFLVFFLIGIWILPDYGISWDEPNQRRHGRVTVDYLNQEFGWSDEKLEPDYQLKDYYWRHYGMLFSVAGHGLEVLVGADDYREEHLVRHYLVFFIFWFGAIGFYRLLLKRFERWDLALLGTLVYILSPRLLAHGFFNVKDAVFMSVFVWGILTMWNFIEKPSLKTVFLKFWPTSQKLFCCYR